MKRDIGKRIERLVRPEIRALTPYGVADPGDLIKLDAMENPYPWPPEIKAEWLDRLRDVDINRYPDAGARKLRPRLRTAMDVPPEQALLLGNGSDEIIQIIMLGLATPGARVLAPTPTFVMYAMTARFVGMEFIGVPLREGDFALDLDAMTTAIHEHDPAVIFLAYPNNPTGNLFDEQAVIRVIEAANGLVVMDEAYHAFSSRSFMNRLGEFDNMVVMRTVSKLGLAGLRLGLLAGDEAWLTEFDKVRLPYNINSLSQASAGFVLDHPGFLQQQTEAIVLERRRLYDAMKDMAGIEVWPSEANFLLFRPRGVTADTVFDGLKRAGILIRNLSHADPLLNGCLRVTVGTPAENRSFLNALKTLV